MGTNRGLESLLSYAHDLRNLTFLPWFVSPPASGFHTLHSSSGLLPLCFPRLHADLQLTRPLPSELSVRLAASSKLPLRVSLYPTTEGTWEHAVSDCVSTYSVGLTPRPCLTYNLFCSSRKLAARDLSTLDAQYYHDLFLSR